MKNPGSTLSATENKPFYGWRIVAASIVILFASSGIGFYCHAVILDPIRAQYGWSKGVVSSAVTFYFATMSIIGFIVGPKIDRYGSRPFLMAGALFFSVSYVLLIFIDQVWQLFLVYFLMAVGWSGSSLLAINTLIANWFIQKRGLAMSITMTGLSLGGMVLVPFASYLIIIEGFQVTILFLSVIYSVIIIPVTFFFIKAHPSELGLLPDGISDNPTEGKSQQPTPIDSTQTRIWTRKEAFVTPAFWSIVIGFFLGLFVQMAFLVHQVSFLSSYLGKMGAAAAVSITAAASIMGRLALGVFVDRFDQRYVSMICFLMQGLAVLTLAFSQNTVILYICTFFFGLTMGSILMMLPLITGRCFGMVSFGLVSGMVGFFSTTGSAFGPMVAGLFFDATQNYRTVFILFAFISFLAMGIILFAKPPAAND